MADFQIPFKLSFQKSGLTNPQNSAQVIGCFLIMMDPLRFSDFSFQTSMINSLDV